jgi:hypothetical protein
MQIRIRHVFSVRRWTVVAACVLVVSTGVLGYSVENSQATSTTRRAPVPPIAAPPLGVSGAKAASWYYSQEARVAHAGSMVMTPATPTVPMTQGFQTGILDDRQGPFKPFQFSGVNSWAGIVDGTLTVVVAGGMPANSGDPFHSPLVAGVFVYTESSSPPAGSNGSMPVGIFAPTPDPVGEFTITGFSGNILSLDMVGSASAFHFNALRRAYS